METVAFCEIDKHCHKVLNKHWPDIPIVDDIKKIKGKNFENIDVICGGFPCQDISVAGQQKGLKHDGKRTRSGLWKEFKRIIKEVGPRYAIIENVANLRSLGLSQVIKDLWSIGYACEWHIISARSVGACHLRERVWIIAYPFADADGDTLRKKQELKQGGEDTSFFGNSGQIIANSDCAQLAGDRLARRIKEEYIGTGYPCGDWTHTNANMPRFWGAFTSEEASQRWWTETTSRFGDVFRKINEIEPTVCRSDDGVSGRLDERARRERVKQLGNSVVPQIPQIIGEWIMKHEREISQQNQQGERSD